MAIAISILAIAAGAILHFAVTKTVSGISLDTVGTILMIVGAGGLVIALVLEGATRARGGRTTLVRTNTPVDAGTTVIEETSR